MAEAEGDRDFAIPNTGLNLAMEWGLNWLRPVQERPPSVTPDLTPTQLDCYNETCGAAIEFGHDEVYRLAEDQRHNDVRYDAFNRAGVAVPVGQRPDLVAPIFSGNVIRYERWVVTVGYCDLARRPRRLLN